MFILSCFNSFNILIFCHQVRSPVFWSSSTTSWLLAMLVHLQKSSNLVFFLFFMAVKSNFYSSILLWTRMAPYIKTFFFFKCDLQYRNKASNRPHSKLCAIKTSFQICTVTIRILQKRPLKTKLTHESAFSCQLSRRNRAGFYPLFNKTGTFSVLISAYLTLLCQLGSEWQICR